MRSERRPNQEQAGWQPKQVSREVPKTESAVRGQEGQKPETQIPERVWRGIEQDQADQALSATVQQAIDRARDRALAAAEAVEGTEVDEAKTGEMREDLKALTDLLNRFIGAGQVVGRMQGTAEEKKWVAARISENQGVEKAVATWRGEIHKRGLAIRRREFVARSANQQKAA